MALNGTVTVTTGGTNVGFQSGNTAFRATSLYVYNLTAGNSIWLDIGTTAGCTTGFTVPPTTFMQFPILHGITGFSTIASTAAGSAQLTYLASR